MDAFKCDGCNRFFDGQTAKTRDLDLDNFMVRLLVARKVEPEPEPEEEKGHQVIMPPELRRLMNMEKPEMRDGMVLVLADLCSDCALDLFRRALVLAQTEDIVAQLVADGEEFRE